MQNYKKPTNKPPIRKQPADDVETDSDGYMREGDFMRDDDNMRIEGNDRDDDAMREDF